jgi:hypothetical protein
MNTKQKICLGLGIIAIIILWVYQGMYSQNFDPTFLVIVSVLVSMVIGGFVLTFKDSSRKG